MPQKTISKKKMLTKTPKKNEKPVSRVKEKTIKPATKPAVKPKKQLEKKKEEKKEIEKQQEEKKDIVVEKEKKEEKKKGEVIWTSAKRKTAEVRAKLFVGQKGNIIINKKQIKEYFPTLELQTIINQPFKAIEKKEGDFNFVIEARGGGMVGQAEAIRRAISLALSYLNPTWRTPLKKAGFLTSDSRIKERKKPGLKRARRAPQWQKR